MRQKTALLLVLAVLLPLAGCNALAGGTATPSATATDSPTDSPTPTPREGTYLRYDGDAVTVESAAGQELAGETDLPDGSELAIRLRASGDNPFLKSKQVTVEDGSFAATFDMSEVPAGTEFEITVRHDGSAVAEASGDVVEN